MQIDVRSNVTQVLARMQRYREDVVDKAIPRALNRVGEQARTYAARKLREAGYNFKRAEILDAIRLVKANSARKRITMYVRRRAKLLLQFDARETKDGVTVKVKGQRKLIRGAFIGQLRNGDRAVFIEDKNAGKVVLRRARQYKHGSRGGWQAYPVRKLYGPSVGGAYKNEQVLSDMQRYVAAAFEKRLAHEVRQLSRQ